MAGIRISAQRSMMIDVPCTRTWTLAASGGIGSASFTLPFNHPAAHPDFLPADGGATITILDELGSGEWYGVSLEPEFTPDMRVAVQCREYSYLLSRERVGLYRTFQDAMVHEIMYLALQDALPASALEIGTVSATAVRAGQFYPFTGQPLWDVIDDMQALSDAEVRLDGHRVSWGPPQGEEYGQIIVAPGKLRNASYRTDATERVQTVVARGPHNWASASVAAEVDLPGAEVVDHDTDDDGQLQYLARVTLAQLSEPDVNVAGFLEREHFGIQAGDTAWVLVPWARYTGALRRMRLVSKTLGMDGRMGAAFVGVPEAPAILPPAITPRRTRRRIHWRDLHKVRRDVRRERVRH